MPIITKVAITALAATLLTACAKEPEPVYVEPQPIAAEPVTTKY